MKYLTIIATLFLLGCDISDLEKANTAIDAARYFTQYCNTGEFDKASNYLTNESRNSDQFAALKKQYELKSRKEKKELADESIVILKLININEKSTDIILKKSLLQQADTLHTILQNNEWVVVFK